jgi:hypothetical protein
MVRSAFDLKHNLNEIITQLKINHLTIPGIKKNLGNNEIQAQNLHQAWRYGKKLDEQEEEETKCIQALTKILGEIENKLTSPGV